MGEIRTPVTYAEDEMIKWLVETLHYPFDLSFSPPPPVDHRILAAYWKDWDGWDDVSLDDAELFVLDEAGLLS